MNVQIIVLGKTAYFVVIQIMNYMNVNKLSALNAIKLDTKLIFVMFKIWKYANLAGLPDIQAKGV